MSISPKLLLLQELSQRQLRNPSYSLRALARDTGISLTALSDVLAGKRDLSPKNLEKLTTALALSPQQKEDLEHNRKKSKKNGQNELTLIAEDEFRLISDWYYLAVLNLAKLKDNRSDPNWITDRLGIEPEQAQEATARLLRLGLIKITGKKMTRTAKPLTTTAGIPSAAIRKYHQQNLHLAEKCLQSVPIELRSFSAVTMLANPEKLPKVKKILFKTRNKIADLLEEGPATEVYTLAFQLFPVTKVDQNTGKLKEKK